MLIRIIRAHFDPEIRDQLWILDRVYQKYPNKKKIFFIVILLELLNRKVRAIRGQINEYLGECIRQIHTHLRRIIVPYSRALGAVRVWESFFLDYRNFRSRLP